jgi:glucose/mannose transport system substrate-binding protein
MKYASIATVAQKLERSSARRLCRAVWLAAGLCAAAAAHAGEVEVLHFWTSPGEAQSIAEIKSLIAERGHTWKDFAVIGGGGQNAMAALRQRVLSGQPPASASIKGPAIQEWAAMGVLANLDAMAAFDHWDKVLPPVVKNHVKHDGHYVAVPVNIHRSNVLWTSAQVLRQSGVKAHPANFTEFMAAAEKVKAAGHIALAHGGQPWQDFVLFESVAIGVGGADFYRRAFVQLDPAALSSAEMRRSLEAFRRLKAFTDDKSPGRAWDATTDLVIRDKAAFQVMGDWAKGEFIAAGRRPGTDFFCAPALATGAAFSYVIDTFAMFQLKNWEAQKAQGYLAYVLLGARFQGRFNRRKGSIPARMDLPLDGFDDCAKAARADFQASEAAHTLVPSVAIGMAPATAIQAQLQSIVSSYWSHDGMTVNDAVSRLLQVSGDARKK